MKSIQISLSVHEIQITLLDSLIVGDNGGDETVIEAVSMLLWSM